MFTSGRANEIKVGDSIRLYDGIYHEIEDIVRADHHPRFIRFYIKGMNYVVEYMPYEVLAFKQK